MRVILIILMGCSVMFLVQRSTVSINLICKSDASKRMFIAAVIPTTFLVHKDQWLRLETKTPHGSLPSHPNVYAEMSTQKQFHVPTGGATLWIQALHPT